MRGKMTKQVEEWAGKFGEEYTDRNLTPLDKLDQPYINNFGISRTELNKEFLDDLTRKKTSGINIVKSSAFEILYKDNYFDLVFTSGVILEHWRVIHECK